MALYNTAAPTSATKNTLNSINQLYHIRDLIISKSIFNLRQTPNYNGLNTAINGSPKIGEVAIIEQQQPNVPLENISTTGRFFRDNNILLNQYINQSPNSNNLLEIITQIDPIKVVDGVLLPTQPWGIDQYESIDVYGLLNKTNILEYRKKNTIKNKYLDASEQTDAAEELNLNNDISEQYGNYLDEFGVLRSSDTDIINTGNIFGGLLNNTATIRDSLLGRVLRPSNSIVDTELGKIAGDELRKLLGYNAAFNLVEETVGRLNLNPLSLIRGNNIIVPNYSITVPSSLFGRTVDFISRVSGFEIPISYLDNSASLFTSENGGIGNIERANNMLDFTGGGQKNALLALMGYNLNIQDSASNLRVGYAPAFNGFEDNYPKEPNIYAYYPGNNKGFVYAGFITQDNAIPDINANRSEMLSNYGFEAPEDFVPKTNITTPTFSWGSNTNGALNRLIGYDPYFEELDKKTLLYKTQKLFNSKNNKNIISVKGDSKNIEKSIIQTGLYESNGTFVMSKGSAVKSEQALNNGGTEPNNIFCRAWTTFRRYDTVDRLVRHRGLDTGSANRNGMPYTRYTDNSVLDDNGFVKVAPYFNESNDKTNLKRYMFSIENLAWADNTENLIPAETGTGDPLTGKKGRIMWFPPYDISFTENSSVNIESTNFIGRGEPVYTYNNTERSGNLSFTVVVDHPTYMNAFRGPNGAEDDRVASFVAGCIALEDEYLDKLSNIEIAQIQSSRQQNNVQAKTVQTSVPPPNIDFYFPNNNFKLDNLINPVDYENGDNNGKGQYDDDLFGRYQEDTTDFGLNKTSITLNTDTYEGWIDTDFIDALKNYLEVICPDCTANITGYASSQGRGKKVPDGEPANTVLARNRANTVKEWLITNNILDESRIKTVVAGSFADGLPNSGTDSPNSQEQIVESNKDNVKKARRATIEWVINPSSNANNTLQNDVPTASQINTTLLTSIRNRVYNEEYFFEKLEQTDKFVFDKFSEKIRYFHPGFHSTTPEGFNSRLTFLLQCTRQGRTENGNENPNNLAFGLPPVCILRIGDFYNTKIYINNVDYSFEPLVWDLNPEGIGVQPMIAKVNISFKFIGGSSLVGPINKLQNALSFNFFANTQVYDPRADKITFDSNGSNPEIVTGAINMNDFYSKETETIISSTQSDIDQVVTNNNNLNISPNEQQVDSNIIQVTSFTNLTGIDVISTNNGIKLRIKISTNKSTPISDDINSLLVKGVKITIKPIDSNINTTQQSLTLKEDFLDDAIKKDNGIELTFSDIKTIGKYDLFLTVGSKKIKSEIIIVQ